jgi:hypothetical protein
MQSQERDLITGLFGRLQPFDAQPRDGEAEALIKDLAARQPSSAYLLVQTVLVQEQALKAAQQRIAELEAKASAAAASPGFLGSAPKIGPWGAAPAPAAEAAPVAAPPPPPSRSPLQAALAPQAPSAGGGFLRSAMTTAAGVAGGALLFEGIRGLFGGSSNPFGQGAFGQGALGQSAMAQPVEVFEQVTPDNNPVPDDFRNNDSTAAAYDDSNQDDNSYDQSNDDMASDGSSSDDDSWT